MYTQEYDTQSFDKTIMGTFASSIKLVFSLAIKNQVSFSLCNKDKQRILLNYIVENKYLNISEHISTRLFMQYQQMCHSVYSRFVSNFKTVDIYCLQSQSGFQVNIFRTLLSSSLIPTSPSYVPALWK